jgi:hypothetical protein
VRRYVQGEMLPDGQILRRIGDNQIEVQKGEDIRRLKLHQAVSQ